MTVAYADFIIGFPEFSNQTTYPEAQFNFWETQAYNQLNECRFGKSMDLAVMLFIAHNIVLSALAAAATASGGIAGGTTGPIASKSVGSVSVSYDDAATALEGAGAWNATMYGQRLYKMIKAFGTGPAYVPGPRRMFSRFGFPR